MIILLDTHALIWSLEDSPRLSATARKLIEDTNNIVLASVASGWEIAIKKALGRLEAPDDLEAAIDSAGFIKRVITFADVQRLGSLPAHHKDPFDRMLVAQSMVEGAPLVSCLIARLVGRAPHGPRSLRDGAAGGKRLRGAYDLTFRHRSAALATTPSP